eukprot:358961-Chlamydomonas_euryale.AAC.16
MAGTCHLFKYLKGWPSHDSLALAGHQRMLDRAPCIRVCVPGVHPVHTLSQRSRQMRLTQTIASCCNDPAA